MPLMADTRSSVTSLSWIPSELIQGPFRVPFDLGLTHYDAPPPDTLGSGGRDADVDDIEAAIAELRRAGRFRFVNRLAATAQVEVGRIVAVHTTGAGVIGRTNLLGGAVRFPAIAMPDLVTVEIADDGSSAVVRQTAGGRAPLPAPRLVQGRPRLVPPVVWTTLELRFAADGTVERDVVGASPFPRHWVYDDGGHLVQKVALTDARSWLRDMTEDDNPWAGTEYAALLSSPETGLERRLSAEVMGRRPRIERLAAGQVLLRQGDPGAEVVLLLDGVVGVSRDGVDLAEIGPGAILGERSLLEGARTATVVAVTDLTVAVLDADGLDRDALESLVEGHRREDS